MKTVAREVSLLGWGGGRAGGPGAIAAALVMLLVIALPVDATELTGSMELDGVWNLDRRENFEEFLKKGGAPWLKRKLARLASSSVRQTIETDGIRFKVTVETGARQDTHVYVADGKTEVEVETAAGDLLVWTGLVEGDVLILRGNGEIGRREVRREIVDGELVMTVLNLDADSWFKFYFTRE